jgi:hypothetical protein
MSGFEIQCSLKVGSYGTWYQYTEYSQCYNQSGIKRNELDKNFLETVISVEDPDPHFILVGWIRIGKNRQKIETPNKGEWDISMVGGCLNFSFHPKCRKLCTLLQTHANDAEMKKIFKIFDSAPSNKISCY